MSRPLESDPPERVNVLGVGVSAIKIADALALIDRWIATGAHRYVCVTGVHGVMESQTDPALRDIHNRAGLVTPDGMPLVWLSWLHGHDRVERVYGPDLMLACCEASVTKGYRHFFYGGGTGVPELLAARLQQRFPGLTVAGTWSPPFRELSEAEEQALIDQDRRGTSGYRLGGIEHAETRAVDGTVRRPSACPGADRRRGCVRHARRREETGTAMDAAFRSRVAVPSRHRTPPAGAAISHQQSLVRVAPPAAIIGNGAARSRPGYAQGLMALSLARIIRGRCGAAPGSQRLKSSGDTSLFAESGA